MSGMKFRLQCAGCGATYFTTDRKTRRCPKCLKKDASKKGAAAIKLRADSGARHIDAKQTSSSARSTMSVEPKSIMRQDAQRPKAAELTPELSEQISKIYQEQFEGSDAPAREIIAQISDRVWLQRKIIGRVVHRLIHPNVNVTSEMKDQIIEMYKGYVDRSERPEGGRRRAIADATRVPLHQVKNIVYEWSQSQYSRSPTPELSRDQLFEIEKIYWNEIEMARYRYSELPDKIAERLAYVTAYQVSRWLDILHDDQSKFDHIKDAAPEAEQRVLEAYTQYLAASQPPENSLHVSIASQVGGVNGRQVHKILQRYRHKRRNEYPLK